jgi:hypothetical protein
LQSISALEPSFPLLVSGRAHGIVPPSSADIDSGTFCNCKPDGGCVGRIVLAPLDQTMRSKRIGLSFKLVKGRGDQGWLTLAWNPTSIVAGDNVHPASIPDASTGEIAAWPSSSKVSLGQMLRLGFVVLEELAQQATGLNEPLFDDSTWSRIRDGDIHIVRVQFCAYLPSPDVPRFLQGLTGLYGHTIATGQGIINLATLQGLKFERPYVNPTTNEVTTVLVIKARGKKPAISAGFYNKEARLREMRQRKGLPEPKTATVLQNVRLDITAHSLGVQAIVSQARRHLKRIEKHFPAASKEFSAEKFLAGEATSTVWYLERAIRILSCFPQDGKLFRASFADWLVPYTLEDVLRLDVVTSFTWEGYESLLKLNNKVAAAWHAAKPCDVDNWASSLAKKAGVTEQTVYNKQKAWVARYKIDIALPYAYYRDALFFGQNSFSNPADRAATLAAHSGRHGD